MRFLEKPVANGRNRKFSKFEEFDLTNPKTL